ncbi:restriction endonuclease subunit S [Sunxiuqinia sp. sy24]|uniref:restriction endonuclease subunit S n=1 Tax=Sunxiuqinia sp. sy24 TaxID=3461495 RepID=UPI0040456613
MRSNYKTLGDYIKPIKKKNSDLKAKELLGINIDKFFMPSVANIVGTDLSRYKVVEKNQFACNRMHVGRDYRIPIALSDRDEPFIVSPAYDVFRIKDISVLHPDYLMMWFSRAEFDRNAWFYTDADVRGGLAWDAFCSIKFPLPSPEKQREIVAEYNTIKNRIELNNQLIQKLEETAQAIYRQWFVDFEFPDENGNPYKSSGGNMVWNEELEKEIPEGWEVKKIKDYGKVITGKTPSINNPEDFGDEMLFVTPGDFKFYNKFVTGAYRKLSEAGFNRLKSKILNRGSVIVTCIGSDMGKVVLTEQSCITNQQMNSINVGKEYYSDYLYYYLKSIYSELRSIALGGSTMPMLSKSEFEIINVLKPSDNLLKHFAALLKPMNEMDFFNSKENQALERLSGLLLSKLSTLEN